MRPSDVRSLLNRLRAVCQCCALGNDRRRVEQGKGGPVMREAAPRVLRGVPVGRVNPVRPPVGRAALQNAVVEELLPNNVAKNLRISPQCRPKFTPWTSEEAKQFLAAARGERRYAVYGPA